jgi:chromate transporter
MPDDNLPSKATAWGRLPAIFWCFFTTAALTLGGGLAMIPLFSQEFVDKRHWLTEEDMLVCTATTQSLPGIIAMNMSVLLGYKMAGLAGALTACLATLLPPFFAIVVLAGVFLRFRDSRYVAKAFLGIRASISALIAVVTWNLTRKICRNVTVSVLATISFLLLATGWVGAVYLVLGGAVVGLLLTWLCPQLLPSAEENLK